MLKFFMRWARHWQASYPVPVTGLVSLPVRMYRKSYHTTPGIGIGSSVKISKMQKFYMKVFYVMGKRHCHASYPVHG